jgi:hypothetical protein
MIGPTKPTCRPSPPQGTLASLPTRTDGRTCTRRRSALPTLTPSATSLPSRSRRRPGVPVPPPPPPSTAPGRVPSQLAGKLSPPLSLDRSRPNPSTKPKFPAVYSSQSTPGSPRMDLFAPLAWRQSNPYVFRLGSDLR